MKKIALIAAISLFGSGAVWAQQFLSQPASQSCKGALASDIRSFSEFHDGVLRIKRLFPFQQEAVKRSGLLSAEFQTGAAKAGLTNGECDALRLRITRQKMSISNALNDYEQAVLCADGVRGLGGNVDAVSLQGVNAKVMTSTERGDANRRATEVNTRLDAAINEARITLDMCRGFAAEVSNELTRVGQLIRTRTACNNDFNRVFAANKKTLDDALAARQISERERQTRRTAEAGVQARYDEAIRDGAITEAECNPLLTEVRNDTEAINRVLTERRNLIACLGDTDRTLAALTTSLTQGIKDQKITPQEEASVRTDHDRLKAKIADMKRDRIVTMEECSSALAAAQNLQVSIRRLASN